MTFHFVGNIKINELVIDILLLILTILHLIFPEKPGKPDAPEIVKVHRNAVAIKWKPPKDDGGAEITNYVIEYRIEGTYNYFINDKI